MTLRDDMVFAPDIGPQRLPNARTRAREERRLAGARKRGGLFRRLRAARALRKSKPGARRARSGSRLGSIARRGVGGLARAGVQRAGLAAFASPVGLAVGALLIAGVTTLRLASGQPLEGTGEMLNRMILGDMDDEARAKLTTRQTFKGDSDIARVVGSDGRVNSQVASIGNDVFELNKRREVGASLLREEFPVNSILDMLILRGKKAFLDVWNGSGGPDKVTEVAARIGSHVVGGMAAGAGSVAIRAGAHMARAVRGGR